MYCYTGVEFTRIYLPTAMAGKEARRIAWKAYMADQFWIADFADLRTTHAELFKRWHDLSAWTEARAFCDSHY